MKHDCRLTMSALTHWYGESTACSITCFHPCAFLLNAAPGNHEGRYLTANANEQDDQSTSTGPSPELLRLRKGRTSTTQTPAPTDAMWFESRSMVASTCFSCGSSFEVTRYPYTMDRVWLEVNLARATRPVRHTARRARDDVRSGAPPDMLHVILRAVDHALEERIGLRYEKGPVLRNIVNAHCGLH